MKKLIALYLNDWRSKKQQGNTMSKNTFMLKSLLVNSIIVLFTGYFYKHQGRKPTTLEWWVECRLID